jgi:hypothetical protein
LIAVRNELGLRDEKCFEEGARQSGIVPMKLKVCDSAVGLSATGAYGRASAGDEQ